jgi:hypothetical protein
MTITTDTERLFLTASQSMSAAKTSSANSRSLNPLSFAEIFEQQTSGTYTPPEIGTYTRSAKATEVREWLLDSAAKDPEKAKMHAHGLAYESLEGPMLENTDSPIMRVSATGEIYTPGMQRYCAKVFNSMQAGRIALYESEVAKGTPHAQILEKVLAYNDTYPVGYRRLLDC